MLKWSHVSTTCILLASLQQPSIALAAPSQLEIQLEHAPQLDLALELQLNDAKGVWFPMLMARQMQTEIEAYRAQIKHVSLLEMQLTVREERVTLLKESLQLTKESAETTAKVVEAAVRGQRKAEESKDGLFAGHPGIWALIGAGLTGILVAVLRK